MLLDPIDDGVVDSMIEVNTFRLAEGVSDDEFLAADKRIQIEHSAFRPGCLRRTTARGAEPGQWLVLTLWASAEAADYGADAIREDELGSAFLALIDGASSTTQRYFELD